MAPSIEKLFAELLPRLELAPASVTLAELRRFCVVVFGRGGRGGEGRRSGGSHLIFRTGLRELPIVNIQPRGKMAKSYQCRQVARAARALVSRKED